VPARFFGCFSRRNFYLRLFESRKENPSQPDLHPGTGTKCCRNWDGARVNLPRRGAAFRFVAVVCIRKALPPSGRMATRHAECNGPYGATCPARELYGGVVHHPGRRGAALDVSLAGTIDSARTVYCPNRVVSCGSLEAVASPRTCNQTLRGVAATPPPSQLR
jgi:hypothetical protein